jgi:hypothetical protein
MELVDRPAEPWATVEGIEFRSVTVQAFKGKDGLCKEHNEAVIYRGPWQHVVDDDGHVFERGVPHAVCRKTFQILTQAPYADHVIPVEPATPIDDSDAEVIDCSIDRIRTPQETKGSEYAKTELPSNTCCGGEC